GALATAVPPSPARALAGRHTLTFAQANGDFRDFEALGRNADGLLTVGHAHVHGGGKIGALDGQHEVAARIAARDQARRRVGFFLPADGHLAAFDLQFGKRIDAVVGAGTAHALAHLAAPVGNLIGDGALDAFGPPVA